MWQGGLATAVLATRLATALAVASALAQPVAAQGLIRDAEIEQTLKRIADPVLRAAGLSGGQVDVYIVDNPRMNAFVAGGNNIFVHSGLLRRLRTVDEVRAVLAHETGHITGGHLARRNEKLRMTQGVAGLGMLLSIAAAVAGGGKGAVAAGIASQDAALRNLLSYTRAEEASADQAGLRYMVGAGADPQAILDVMKLFRGQDILSEARADPYVRTHPLWSDRLRYLEDRVASAPRGGGISQTDAYWHGRMVAKFDGFTGSPQRVLRTYAEDKTEVGALARAVAYHRLPDIRKAMATVDALIRARPQDAFYHELKGQFLIENGDASGAVAAYRQAVALAPSEPLLLAGLGRALVALNQPGATREALTVLERARTLDQADARVLRDLALAYARTGQPGRASLATAERFALQGNLRDASVHARRAAAQLAEGSAGWRQAQDILRAAERVLNKG